MNDGRCGDTRYGEDVKGTGNTMRESIGVLLFLIMSYTGVSAQTYSTNFSLTENPISENGRWSNGQEVGLDWSNVATAPGVAYGTQTGFNGFDDSTALLIGTWGPDQHVMATVRVDNPNPAATQEVELRLRSSLSAHSSTGYEILFSVVSDSQQIIRWNGPLGDFTPLSESAHGAKNGDVVEASIVGNLISVYINGVLVDSVTDTTYASGNPGIGFFTRDGGNQQFGFTTFTATGSGPSPPTPAPTPAVEPSGGGGGGCFIATAAYGSPLAPEVERLRKVRDRYLLAFDPGRHLVAVYYRLSPSLAAVIAHSPPLRVATRVVLTPVLAWAGLFLWSPILGVTVPLAGLSLVGLGGMAWRRHRTSRDRQDGR
jgi:hypothetical protein